MAFPSGIVSNFVFIKSVLKVHFELFISVVGTITETETVFQPPALKVDGIQFDANKPSKYQKTCCLFMSDKKSDKF